ncbi:recombinase family protein [Paeniglutamicibacter sp. Y32M11]|uniref:recombinase family protein n=1 Tax=Paeniglutamicibacter sp. Y32M11 TaxID=2853258 RepID=UPI001C5326B0|nr:recombinase family protein [Paeniglutamicibacter sp. Y32M11]QXQ11491.1 recombinase family protein [Paeniglutamicibacter sp. Y32M11]
MTTPPTAAIYARLSQDKKQGTDDEGLSTEQQVKVCQEWISRQGWTLGKIYRDNNFSATSGATRPEFEAMLSEAPSHVVFWKQDRLERGHNNDLDRFLLAGIDGYGVDGSRVTVDSASSEFMTRIQSLMGKHEQRIKSERIKLANQRIAGAGTYRGSIRPFGQERDGTWVDKEAKAVRQAAKHLLSEDEEQRWSFYRISEVWNIAGLLTPQTGKQGGKQWTPGTVRNYFTRPRLMGKQDYRGTLYELKGWKPLLTPEQFSEIQDLIERKKLGKRISGVTRHDVRLLTNIIRCAEPGCDRGMNAGQRGGAGSPRSYRCPTTKHVTITAEKLEAAISTHALDLLSQHKEIRAQQEGTARRLTEVQGEKHRISIAHDEWISEAIETDISPSIIKRKEAKHAEKISELDAELFNLNQDKTLSIFEGYELDGWNAAPMDLRRDLLTSVFAEIKIRKGGQGKRFSPEVIDYSYTPLGQKLCDKWIRVNAMNPWELKEGSASSREPIASRIKRIKAGTTTLGEWTVDTRAVTGSTPGGWNPVDGSRTKKQNEEFWAKLITKG